MSVSGECCQEEVSANVSSLVQSSHTECVLLGVIRCNINPLQLQQVGRKRSE